MMVEVIVLRELGARRKTHKASITSKKNHFPTAQFKLYFRKDVFP